MALPEQIQHIQKDPGIHAAIAGIHLVHRARQGETSVSDDTLQAAHNDAANVLFPQFRSRDAVVAAYRNVRTTSLNAVSRLVGDPNSFANTIEEDAVPEVFMGIYLEEAGPRVAEVLSQVIKDEPEVTEGELETVRFMHSKWGEQVGFEESQTTFADTDTTVYEATEQDPEEERIENFITEIGAAFPQLISSDGSVTVQQKALASKMGGSYRYATWAAEEGHVNPTRTGSKIEYSFLDLVILRIIHHARSQQLPLNKRDLASQRGNIEKKINEYIANSKEVN